MQNCGNPTVLLTNLRMNESSQLSNWSRMPRVAQAMVIAAAVLVLIDTSMDAGWAGQAGWQSGC